MSRNPRLKRALTAQFGQNYYLHHNQVGQTGLLSSSSDILFSSIIKLAKRAYYYHHHQNGQMCLLSASSTSWLNKLIIHIIKSAKRPFYLHHHQVGQMGLLSSSASRRCPPQSRKP
jgi:hypothetical protein